MNPTIAHWNTKPPTTVANIESIATFDARGMRRVYGRGDRFGNRCSFTMDIWKTRDNRLFMRFWSHSVDIEDHSFEIQGVHVDNIPARGLKSSFPETWMPEAVRATYDQWIQDEL